MYCMAMEENLENTEREKKHKKPSLFFHHPKTISLNAVVYIIHLFSD